MTTNITLNHRAWLNQHAAIYAGHDWPTGALLAVTAQKGSPDKELRGKLNTVGFAPITDAEAAWELMTSRATSGQNTWVSLAGLRPETAESKGRGGRSDVLALPALFADIDFASGVHAAGDSNPSPEEASAWVDKFETEICPATLLNHSGGGYHLLVGLTELLDPSNSGHMAVVNQWKSYWVSLAAEAGRNIDKGVLADVSRIYRAAGTWNANQLQPVTTEEVDPSARYSIAELGALLPPLVEAASTPRKKTVRPSASSVLAAAPAGDDDRAGTRFSYSMPVSQLAADLFNARIDGDRITFPRDDGTYGSESNAAFYPATAEQPERLTVFGDRVLASLDLEFGNSLSSFEFIATTVLGGDFKLTTRLIVATELENGWDDTVAARLREYVDAGELDLAPHPERLNTIVVLPNIDGSFPESALMESPKGDDLQPRVQDAIDNRIPARIELFDGLVVLIHSERGHGLYRQVPVKDNDGNVTGTKLDQVTNWIAWRPVAIREMGIDADGVPVEVEKTYSVEIVRADGFRRRMDGFDASSAVKPLAIVDKLDAGVALPIANADIARVATMLRQLGYEDGEKSVSYGSLGWLKDPDTGKHVFLEPAGSVTAAGATPGYTVGAPPASDTGALNAAAMNIGHPVIPQSNSGIRDAAAAVPAFLAITPKRSDCGFAVLGAILASPLALSGRTTVLLTADPEVGKSFEMGAALSFVTGVMDGKTFTGGALLSDSKVAVEVKSSWARHSVVGWDDFKDAGTEADNKRVLAATVAAITQAFGGTGASAGTQGGGLRRARQAQCIAIMTAEGTPPGTGYLSRVVRIELAKGDVDVTPIGSCGYDKFRDGFTGLAREVFGAYIQHLAARLDEIGLAAFTRENDEAKREWMKAGSGRTAETVATLAVGWVRFREFADDKGFADLLPVAADVDKALLSLATANTENIQDQNAAATIVAAARDALQSRQGYIEPSDGQPPTGDLARSLGWVARDVRDQMGIRTEWIPGIFRIGYLSDDGSSAVVISGDAISRFRKTTGLGFVPKDQLARAALAVVVPGSEPGERSPADLFKKRNRGWVVSTSLLDLDLTPEPVTAPEVVELDEYWAAPENELLFS